MVHNRRGFMDSLRRVVERQRNPPIAAKMMGFPFAQPSYAAWHLSREQSCLGVCVCSPSHSRHVRAAGASPDLPSHTVKLVVPMRRAGPRHRGAHRRRSLSVALGQSVVVENAGATGASERQASPVRPDGHTLLVGQTGEIAIIRIGARASLRSDKDLLPIALATWCAGARRARQGGLWQRARDAETVARAGLSFAPRTATPVILPAKCSIQTTAT